MSERKYGQRGYLESDSSERKQPQGQRPTRDGPRGRGLGAPKNEVFRCRDCGTAWPIFQGVAFDAACAQCGAPLHSCVNCAYFDTGAPNECRKPLKERVSSKTKANECELFAAKITVESDGGQTSGPEDPRAAFDALFK